MTIDDILLEAEEKMTKTEEVVQHEFAGVRTGKASAVWAGWNTRFKWAAINPS